MRRLIGILLLLALAARADTHPTLPVIMALAAAEDEDGPVTDGLVSHWAFDGNYNDSHGTNHGSATGSPISTNDAVRGTAYYLNGSAYIDMTQSTFSDYPYTLSCWVKGLNGAECAMSIASGSDAYYAMLGYRSDLGYLLFRRFAQNAAYNVSLGAGWHHIAGVAASNNHAVLYLDGLPVATNTSWESAIGYSAVRIGKTADVTPLYPFTGYIDEARLYSIGLSDAQVWTNYKYNEQ